MSTVTSLPPSLFLSHTHPNARTHALAQLGLKQMLDFPSGIPTPRSCMRLMENNTAVAMQESIGASFSYTLAQEQLAYIVFRTCHTFTLSADATDKRADSPF